MEIKSKEYFQELFSRVYSTLQKSGFDIEKNLPKLPDFNKLDDTDIFEGLCKAIFSIQAVWNNYEKNFEAINKLLFYYNLKKISELCNDEIEQIYTKIKSLKIRDRFLNKKLYDFRDNAKTFLKIANRFGSVHRFIEQNFTNKEYLITQFTDHQSEYKLSRVGLAICSEFFKNIGIDDFKPDLHMNRFFARIGLIDNPTFKNTPRIDFQIRKIGIEFANKIGKPAHHVDSILWLFCAEGKGEICSSKPKCQKCELYTKEPKLCKGHY